jgi:hypothetical protein
MELRYVVYAVMLLGAYRLFTVDLAQDRKAALVVSLVSYGVTLMLLPRWISAVRKAQS